MVILANNHMNGKSVIVTTNRGWNISLGAFSPYLTKHDLHSQMSNGQGSHNLGCFIQVTMCLCAHHLVQT